MDNNRYSSNRPRRKVSRRTYRNRRLAALAIIAFLILLLIVLIANACADDKDKKPKTDTKNGKKLLTRIGPDYHDYYSRCYGSKE